MRKKITPKNTKKSSKLSQQFLSQPTHLYPTTIEERRNQLINLSEELQSKLDLANDGARALELLLKNKESPTYKVKYLQGFLADIKYFLIDARYKYYQIQQEIDLLDQEIIETETQSEGKP